MKKYLLIINVCILLCLGCEKKGSVEFIDVVQDHKELTTETNDALIASIRDDMQSLNDPNAIKGAEELIERLDMIKDQSEIICEYVFTTVPDQELLAQLLRLKWKGSNDVTVYEENVP